MKYVNASRPQSQKMSYRSVTCLLAFAALLVFVLAFECQKRPHMSHKNANDCCRTPKPNFRAFPNECAKFVKNYQKPTSLCLLECFMKESKTLENGTFNAINAKPLLLKLFNDTSVGEAHVLAFEKCAAIVNQSIKDFEENGILKSASVGQKCSPLAVVFTMCVHKYVYIYCPVNFWRPTPACEKMKEYAINCDLSPSGRSGRRTGF